MDDANDEEISTRLVSVSAIEIILYRKLYIISKEELAKRNFAKWKDYELSINIDILDKLKNFNQIDELVL